VREEVYAGGGLGRPQVEVPPAVPESERLAGAADVDRAQRVALAVDLEQKAWV
jgi:hypothetical protein